MKRFVFSLAAGGLFASAVTAQNAPVQSTPVPAPVVGAAPAVVSPLPVADVFTPAPTTSTRRGLFGRLRGRNNPAPVMNATPVAYPLNTGTVITNPGTVIPAPTTTPGTFVPTPMPPAAPAPRSGGTSSAMPTVVGNPVVVASGTTGGNVMPAGGVVTMNGMVMPAGGVVVDANRMVMPVGGAVMSAPGLGIVRNGTLMPGSVSDTGTYMMPAPIMTTTTATTTTKRMGLIARIRARR